MIDDPSRKPQSFRDFLWPRKRSRQLVFLVGALISLAIFAVAYVTETMSLLVLGLFVIPGFGWYSRRRGWI